jgi:hypothetical protein
MKQPRISAMEKPGGAHFTLETLRRLAEAFDVALIVRFAPFGELLDWSHKFNPDTFRIPNFEAEQAFAESTRKVEEALEAIAAKGHEAITSAQENWEHQLKSATNMATQMAVPAIPAVAPRLSDLVSAVAEQNPDLKRAISGVTLGMGPMLAALESQSESVRAAVSGIFTESAASLWASIKSQQQLHPEAVSGVTALHLLNVNSDLMAQEQVPNTTIAANAAASGATGASQRGQVVSIDTGRSRNKFSRQRKPRTSRLHRARTA